MKNLIFFLTILILTTGCQKNEPIEVEEEWEQVFVEINEEILDFKVNNEELHLISDKHFYRIKGEEIVEKRELEYSNNLNYSQPQIGDQLIFRLLNFDTIIFLELQPIKEGGLTTRIDLQSFGEEDLTFPITHSFGTLNVGRFDEQNNFLFTGFDYPSIQQFIVELKVEYNEASNIIENIETPDRIELTPISPWDNSLTLIEDVFGVKDISFISAGSGGTYRFQNGEVEHFQDLKLKSFFIDGQDYYGTTGNSDLINKSSDGGLSWIDTDVSLTEGDRLYKKGAYFIESNTLDQIFRIGKSIEEMEVFDISQFEKNYVRSNIEYYNGKYLLIGNIDCKNQILQRSTLN